MTLVPIIWSWIDRIDLMRPPDEEPDPEPPAPPLDRSLSSAKLMGVHCQGCGGRAKWYAHSDVWLCQCGRMLTAEAALLYGVYRTG